MHFCSLRRTKSATIPRSISLSVSLVSVRKLPTREMLQERRTNCGRRNHRASKRVRGDIKRLLLDASRKRFDGGGCVSTSKGMLQHRTPRQISLRSPKTKNGRSTTRSKNYKRSFNLRVLFLFISRVVLLIINLDARGIQSSDFRFHNLAVFIPEISHFTFDWSHFFANRISFFVIEATGCHL